MSEQREGVAGVSNPREPYVHSGGTQEPGADIEKPPYADRQTTGKSEDELVAERGGPGKSEVGPRTVSKTESEGVDATDTTAASPLGVGESIVNQGNEQMLNKSAAAKKAEQTDVGVGGHTKNVDPASPDVLSGDQGG